MNCTEVQLVIVALKSIHVALERFELERMNGTPVGLAEMKASAAGAESFARMVWGQPVEGDVR